ncbi:MAG: AarF/UbiB family protein, partial [Candidatus Deferrimicrobiaceae bacterium]
VFNADPHPGNYLFHADGRITYLDFGCTQPIPEATRAAMAHAHRAGIDRDRNAFARSLRVVTGTVEGPYENALTEYMWGCYEPLFTAPYHMRREYVATIVRDTQALKRHLFDRRARVTPLRPELALLNRLPCHVILSGYPSALYDAQLADWRALEIQVMNQAGVRTEKLWLNFAPDRVFWPGFAGKNFTDRQRIKRKAESWARRYQAMPPGERLAVLAGLMAIEAEGA